MFFNIICEVSVSLPLFIFLLQTPDFQKQEDIFFFNSVCKPKLFHFCLTKIYKKYILHIFLSSIIFFLVY